MTKRKQICQKIRELALPLAKEQKIDWGCTNNSPEYVDWYEKAGGVVHVLIGWCGICSVAIAKTFRQNDFDAHIHMGKFRGLKGHCWIHSDGMNYDVTATQFGLYPKIIITQNNHLYPNPHHIINPQGKFSHFSEWHEAYQPTDIRIDQLLEKIQLESVDE